MTDEPKLFKELNDEEFLELDDIQKIEKYRQAIDVWKRTAADLVNYQNRKASEHKELVEFSKQITVMKLMPSLESLEQVLIYAPDDPKYKEWLTGLKATIVQLEKNMEELGVTKIKTLGQPFDPHLHEAVEEAEGTPGEIIKELQPGFMLNNKVISPAKVVVGKRKE